MSIVGKVTKVLIKSAPLIASVAASAGVVAVGYFSAKGRDKQRASYEEAKQRGEELTKKDKIIKTTAAYLPAGAVGAVTIACIATSFILSNRQIKALTAAGVAAAASFSKYRQEVAKDVGVEAEQEIMEKAKAKPEVTEIRDGHDKFWLFEPVTQQYINGMSEKDINSAMLEVNKSYSQHGAFDLNEYLEALDAKTAHEFDNFIISRYNDQANYGAEFSWVEHILTPCQGPKGHENEEAYEIRLSSDFVLPCRDEKYFEDFMPVEFKRDGKNLRAFVTNIRSEDGHLLCESIEKKPIRNFGGRI